MKNIQMNQYISIYLPPIINRMTETETYSFDGKFRETFYDNSWFEDYNQAEILSKIKSPIMFLKANTAYDRDLLVAALSDDDADRVVDCTSNATSNNFTCL